MLTSRDLIAIVTLALLLISYTVLAVFEPTGEPTKRLGELLSIVVIAIVTYYLGYSRRIHYEAKSNPTTIGHWVPHYVKRLGYILLGFGIALIIQHVVCYGVDLEPTELLLGHEFLGTYCVIVAMILIGLSKKTETLVKYHEAH